MGLNAFWISPTGQVVICQAPRVNKSQDTVANTVTARQSPHDPTDGISLCVLLETVLCYVCKQRGILRVTELGYHDGCEPSSRCAIGRDIAGSRWGHAECVEAIPVQRRFNHVTVARVDIFTVCKQIELPNNLVGPCLIGEAKVHWVATISIPDGGTAVAGRRQEVFARRQGGEVFAILQTAPGYE